MDGYQFVQGWQFSQHFLIEIKTFQSHRYSSKIRYSNVRSDKFYFYVSHIEEVSKHEEHFLITGYLYRHNTYAKCELLEKQADINCVVNDWIFVKNLMLMKRHSLISVFDDESNPIEEQLKSLKEQLKNPTTYFKVGNICELKYGDGGECTTNYRLLFVQNLGIVNAKEIVKFLVQLGKLRNDWNPKAPVLDIIDPDLYPVYYSEDIWVENGLAIMAEEDIKIKRIIARELMTKSAETLIQEQSECERYKYHWKPINVLISKNFEEVSFLTMIPGLTRSKENESFYSYMEDVLKKMLPAFEELGIINREDNHELQVILKAQMYRIIPGTSYDGKWHTEGVTERIVAVGTYYAFIDSFLEGGNLEFNLKSFPDENYALLKFVERFPELKISNCNYQIHDASFIEEVEVTNGSAVVFANDLPHRFMKIINPADKAGHRVFINFFIVDPKNRLQIDGKACSLNEFEIFEQRERIRDILMETRKGWGHIHYGNCGEVGYVDRQLFGKPIRSFNDFYGDDFTDEIPSLK